LNALVIVGAEAACPSLDRRRSCSAVPSREQVEHPDYPPLPPMVVLEDVGVLVNDLMRLAMMGRLP
jgi:hypothetical protein